MKRVFDRFGFGVRPFRGLFDMEPAVSMRSTFGGVI